MSEITFNTRKIILDDMTLSSIKYHDGMDIVAFLDRIFNLETLVSKESRCKNAYEEFNVHIGFNDWSDDQIFRDSRINLYNCDDDKFLKFLSETIHPAVRSNPEETIKLLEMYNSKLRECGYEIAEDGEISGKKTYAGRKITVGLADLEATTSEIKQYLNTEYVNSKIAIMKDVLNRDDTETAIGTAKELIETACKSILQQKGVAAEKKWNFYKLLEETKKTLDFTPAGIENADKAKNSIEQILGGIAFIVQGVAELRNSYGTGHGKDADFTKLESIYAQLLVGVVSNIVLFYLAVNGENAELVEENTNDIITDEN